jgi:mono/diheme cytochrome c family protein
MIGRTRAAIITVILLIIVGALFRAKAEPSIPADSSSIAASEGGLLAHTLCINCHVVDTQGPLVRTDRVPSLPWIAQQPGLTPEYVTNWLSTSHQRMPDYTLTREEIRQLTAYIFSLRKQQ